MSKFKDILSNIKTTISNIWEWMRTDGLLHCLVSAILFLMLAKLLNPVGAAIITLSVGVFKEIYDEYNGGSSESHDIVCDVIGIALGVLIFLEYIVL